MDSYDGLKVCIVCGDCYTLSDMCSSCSRQRMIDEDTSFIQYTDAKYKCLRCYAGIDSLDIECPNCGYQFTDYDDIPF